MRVSAERVDAVRVDAVKVDRPVGARALLRRVVSAVAGVAVAAVALSGCLYAAIPEDGGANGGSGGGGLPTVSGWAEVPTSTAQPTDLEGYYAQELEWVSCVEGFDCAYVLAPLDYDNPASGTIDLAVVRHRATAGEAVGSLLTNPGGPGGSGVSFIADSLDYAIGDPIKEQFDVIGFDPRGVGESTAVACFDAAEMDAYLYDIPEAPRGTPEWEDELQEANEAFAQACEANSGGILEHITTENSARDLDVLRAVLGDEKLNYIGFSYGTFLGSVYAKLFPENVGRVVFDGALDPSVSSTMVGATQMTGFENALRAYMAGCLDDSGCPFRGTVDEGMRDIQALLADLATAPLQASDGRMMGVDSMLTGIILPLYSEDNWPLLTTGFADILSGDPDMMFFLADFYNGREGGQYVDNSTEAFRAYNCMDYPDDSTDADYAEAKALMAAEAPTFAPYWDGPDACAVWPYPPSGEREIIAAEGAAPIVVVGTTGDPATPYEWSVALADQLASGVLVTNEGEGHTGYNKGNDCVDEAIEGYLIEGVVPADGACG